MNRKFKIDDCWARNMFSMTNIDFCMANKTLEGVNEYVQEVIVQGLLAGNMFSRSNMDYSLSEVTSQSMRMYRKFIIEDC